MKCSISISLDFLINIPTKPFRSQAAEAQVSKLKPVLVQSKKNRKKIKKEIVNGNPPFKKLDEDNNKVVDQINIDVSDLERKLKELNRSSFKSHFQNITLLHFLPLI